MTKRIIFLLALGLVLAGCREEEESSAEATKPTDGDYFLQEVVADMPDEAATVLRAVAGADVGIDFTHRTGAEGNKLMPETMGPGCGMLDLDRDGRMDLVFVDGQSWDIKAPATPLLRVYRGGDAGFTDATEAFGLSGITGYGMGVAAGDHDGDGDTDLAVTTVFGVRLLRNDVGTFTDVTEAAGLGGTEGKWYTSASWLDMDGDGWLDLVAAGYVRWSVESDVFTTLNGTDKSYAVPSVYDGLPNLLLRNRGEGTFEDVSDASGFAEGENKGLGIAIVDVNDDGAPDLFVSNDTTANKLYVNDGAGHFTDMALVAGTAYDESGRARAGMGVDAAQPGGTTVIAVGNFSDEAVSHFEAQKGDSWFVDAAQSRGLALHTQSVLTFGLRFADFDADGRQDLLLANGHIEPEITEVQSAVSYRQPIELYRLSEEGRYHDPLVIGDPIVGRCIAVGDIDGDIDQDAVITENGGAPVLLINETGSARQILVDLDDPDTPNREAIGASITLVAGDWSQTERIRARGSYLGHSPYSVHFAVPEAVAQGAVRLTVLWPDGSSQEIADVALGQRHFITHSGPGLD